MALDPKQPNTYFMRAAAYEAKKDHDKAIVDLDEAIRLDASRGDFYMLRGIVFSQKGELDRAVIELDQKVKLDPKPPSASPSAPTSIGRRRTTTAPSPIIPR